MPARLVIPNSTYCQFLGFSILRYPEIMNQRDVVVPYKKPPFIVYLLDWWWQRVLAELRRAMQRKREATDPAPRCTTLKNTYWLKCEKSAMRPCCCSFLNFSTTKHANDFREAVKNCFFLGIIPIPLDPPRALLGMKIWILWPKTMATKISHNV